MNPATERYALSQPSLHRHQLWRRSLRRYPLHCLELRVPDASRADSVAHILLRDHLLFPAGHCRIRYKATQCQKRQRVGLQKKCTAKAFCDDMYVAVRAGEVVPHDGGLSILGVCAAKYLSGNKLAQRYTSC